MTDDRFEELMRSFPHRVQRGAQSRGGKTKRCIPDWPLAEVMARAASRMQGRYMRAYRCDLEGPAVGRHWHLTSERRPRGS